MSEANFVLNLHSPGAYCKSDGDSLQGPNLITVRMIVHISDVAALIINRKGPGNFIVQVTCFLVRTILIP